MNFKVVEVMDKHTTVASGVIDYDPKNPPKEGVMIFDSNWFKGKLKM